MSISINGNGITSANIADGAITNADIADVAASKLTGALPAIDGSNLTGLSGGLYSSVAIICDQKAYNATSGTFTSGAWRTRDLNTEISDIGGIVSIASNQFTLQAGTYTIDWSAPVYVAKSHTTRLNNITDGIIQYGTCEYIETSSYSDTRSFGSAIVTLASAKVFEIQHRNTNTRTTWGFGQSQNTDATAVSIFTIATIHKHS